jgi:beta-glucosidase
MHEKIGQMIQIDINALINDQEVHVNDVYIPTLSAPVGALLNSLSTFQQVQSGPAWQSIEWRQLIYDIQEVIFNLNNTKSIPILYGLDSVHGAGLIFGAAIYPHQLGMAATFNPDLAYKVAAATSKDHRAVGVSMIFGPSLDVATNPLNPRFGETYGEDPYLVSQMGASTVKGIQDKKFDGGAIPRVASCIKHFIGSTAVGHNRSPVEIGRRSMEQIFRPGFQAGIDAGALCVMDTYHDIDGVPMATNTRYLNRLLRQQMNFRGVLISEYGDADILHQWLNSVSSDKEGIKQTLEASSIDIFMMASDIHTSADLLSLLATSDAYTERIDASLERILKLKESLGLITTYDGKGPVPFPLNDPLLWTVGQPTDWHLALSAARESITLVKNAGNVLPLDHTMSFFITGPASDSLASMCGPWTFHWQGAFSESEFSNGMTIRGAIEYRWGTFYWGDKHFHPGPSFNDDDLTGVDMARVTDLAKDMGVIVVCLGEPPYAEKPGDVDDLSYPRGQTEYVKELKKIGPPVILVLVGGRPRLLNGAAEAADAVLIAHQPGPMGGQAVAEILGGNYNPSGRLPYTYPKHPADIPYQYYHKVGDKCAVNRSHEAIETELKHTESFGECETEWKFGDGFGYTVFEYSDFAVTPSIIDEHSIINVTVNVHNAGSMEGMETVMLFAFVMYRKVTPEHKLLKRFQKLHLNAGERKMVSWRIPAEDFKYIGIDYRYVLENGEIRLGIGNQVDCRQVRLVESTGRNHDERTLSDPRCLGVNLQVSSNYYPVCDAACALWHGEEESLFPFDNHDESALSSSSSYAGVSTSGFDPLPTEGNLHHHHDNDNYGRHHRGICGEHISKSVCRATCIAEGWPWRYVECLEDAVAGCKDPHEFQCYDPFNIRKSGTEELGIKHSGEDDDDDDDGGDNKYQGGVKDGDDDVFTSTDSLGGTGSTMNHNGAQESSENDHKQEGAGNVSTSSTRQRMLFFVVLTSLIAGGIFGSLCTQYWLPICNRCCFCFDRFYRRIRHSSSPERTQLMSPNVLIRKYESLPEGYISNHQAYAYEDEGSESKVDACGELAHISTETREQIYGNPPLILSPLQNNLRYQHSGKTDYIVWSPIGSTQDEQHDTYNKKVTGSEIKIEELPDDDTVKPANTANDMAKEASNEKPAREHRAQSLLGRMIRGSHRSHRMNAQVEVGGGRTSSPNYCTDMKNTSSFDVITQDKGASEPGSAALDSHERESEKLPGIKSATQTESYQVTEPLSIRTGSFRSHHYARGPMSFNSNASTRGSSHSGQGSYGKPFSDTYIVTNNMFAAIIFHVRIIYTSCAYHMRIICMRISIR